MHKPIHEFTTEQLFSKLGQLEAFLRDPSDLDEMNQLIHNLELHQIELELQNRELQNTRDLLEETLNLYSNLYDFAPTGYLTLDEAGNVIESNLTTATLLQVDRESLIGKPFFIWVAKANVQQFFDILEKVNRFDKPLTVQLGFLVNKQIPIPVLMTVMKYYDVELESNVLRTSLTDLTDCSWARESLYVQ